MSNANILLQVTGSQLMPMVGAGAGDLDALLARGERLIDIDTYGLMQENLVTGQRHWNAVRVIDHVEVPSRPEDEYDLILVAVRHAQALDALAPSNFAATNPEVLERIDALLRAGSKSFPAQCSPARVRN